MQIAVNTRFLIPGTFEGFGHYTHEILRRVVQEHPDDLFRFYFDRPFDKTFLYGTHVSGKALPPPARHPVLFYLWFQWSLRRAIQKHPADVFFSPDSFMPLGITTPSVITVHDVAHQPYPEGVSAAQRYYYKTFMPRFIQEATQIITVSHFSKAEILQYYAVDPQKIRVIYNGVGDEYIPLGTASRDAVRARWSRGAPYFLFTGAIHPRKNVARLINAFSHFREAYGTDLKLVIAGRKSWDFRDVENALQQSRYGQDVIFTGYVPKEELAGLTASAEALCYISLYEGFGLPVAESMRCGVPVIVTEDSAQSEVAGESGLAVNPLDIEEVAQAMYRVISDSSLRDQMIEKGIARSDLFSWDTCARETYHTLAETAASTQKL